MVTESPVTMLSEMGRRPLMGGGGDVFSGEEVGFLLQEQRRQEASDRERELNLFRSGSAPPTVEGSLSALRGLFGGDGAGGLLGNASAADNGKRFLTEEELRSHPAYHAYYYSQANLNPRLPPPLRSKEDWRSSQRFQPGSSKLGRIGDRRKTNHVEESSRSLFSTQPGAGEWLDKRGDGLIGLPGIELDRKNSFIDIFQDDVGHTAPVLCNPSRPTSRNAFDNGAEPLASTKAQFSLNQELGSVDDLQSSGNVKNVAMVQNTSVATGQTFASILGSSLSRSATPEPQVTARAPSPCFPPVGVRPGGSDGKTNNGSCSFNGATSHAFESANLVAALSGLNLAPSRAIDEKLAAQSEIFHELDDHRNFLLDMQGSQNHNNQHPYLKNSEPEHISMSSFPQSVKPSYRDLAKDAGGLADFTNSTFRPNSLVEPRKLTFSSADSYLKAPSAALVANRDDSPYTKVDNVNTASSYGLCGFSTSPELASMMGDHVNPNNWPPLFGNGAVASPGMDPRALGGGLSSQSNLTGADVQNLKRIGNEAAASATHQMLIDPLYIQYLRAAEFAAQSPMERGYMGNSYGDLLGNHKAYLGGLVQTQKPHGMPFLGISGGLNHDYYGNSAFGLGMSYPRSPLASPVLSASPALPGSPLRHCERSMHFPSGMRNLAGGVMGSWHMDASSNMDDSYASSLLEEFKNNKSRSYELSDITGHIVEFSADQYGSRFIQQKLETATTEEKNMVFAEIMPQALTLMTDVFGNYVVQKFFEHGSAAQRRELADQLSGHVLALSLQMYGCRVIQKAIEVVDLDQKTKLVAELDGYVMRCVRDQNGNHVIQKCIECIPQDAIQFIVSTFYDQVVTLSTHPYGCRVIQRVLEHCDDPKTQQILMDAIFQSVCMLAKDQYGNYVVQHVLEHGKPHERSAIIKKLAGQIVQMSQQKFASNVVEKCLTFGGPMERQILVNEMLGSTEENEPLQEMMKDQFGNYVVQKVLETCDEQQRELILTRIKVHLSALKKYTYGKHIVARVEKLVTAGERRIAMQSTHTS